MNILNKINPLVKKEIKTSSRSVKLSVGLFVFELIISLIWLLSIGIIMHFQDIPTLSSQQDFLFFFPIFAIAEASIVALIMPILTAGSISGEKERQTFDLMLTTPLSPFKIALGKLYSAFVKIMLYIIGSLPILAIPFITGSLPWYLLGLFFLCLVVLSCFSGSIGLFCSSISRNTISALIKTFIFYLLFFGGTFIPLIVTSFDRHKPSIIPILFFLINPGVIFEEDLVLSLSSVSIFGSHQNEMAGILDSYFYDYRTHTIYYEHCFLFKGPTFAIVSGISLLLLSFVFLKLTAFMIDPKNSPNRRPKKNKKNTL